MKTESFSPLVSLIDNARTVGSSAYFGECADWLIAAAIHRDSGALSRSNWRVIQKALSYIDPGALQVERFTHWAVGWVDYLIIRPDAAAVLAECQRLRARLVDYPVLNEEDFSEEEQNEANEVWKNCYRQADRVEYIRKNRSQFEFHGLRDAVGCIRGDYFAGYASELLS